MSYSGEIIRRATKRLDDRKARRAAEWRERREKIYGELPELQEIDARIRAGMLLLASLAFEPVEDPAARTEEIHQENLALRARRTELLTANGWEADALDDVPCCRKCSDRGWIGSEMCTCLQELCAEEQIAELSYRLDLGDQSFETFSLAWYSTQFNEQLGTSPRENMAMVERICRNYATHFDKYVDRNLFLTGDPGLGKTFLSACIARVVSQSGHSVVYNTATAVFTDFEDDKFNRGEEATAAVRRYLNCDLMILDDLGSEMTTAMTQSSLYTLVNSRLISDRHTVISSNLSPSGIRERYLPMIASRLEGEYRELDFVGRDIRLLRSDGRTGAD